MCLFVIFPFSYCLSCSLCLFHGSCLVKSAMSLFVYLFVLVKFVCFCLSVYFDFVLLPLSRYSWFVSAVSPAVSTCPNHLPILSHSPFVPCWNLKLLKFPSCFSVFSGLSIFATLGSSQFMFVVFLLYFMFSLSLYPSHQKGKKTKQKNLQKKIKITSNVVKENTSKTQSKMYHFLSFDKKQTNQKVNYSQLKKCFPYFLCYKAIKLPFHLPVSIFSRPPHLLSLFHSRYFL